MKAAKHWIYSDDLENALFHMTRGRDVAIPYWVQFIQAIQRDALDGAAERVAAFAWAEETIRAMKDEL